MENSNIKLVLKFKIKNLKWLFEVLIKSHYLCYFDFEKAISSAHRFFNSFVIFVQNLKSREAREPCQIRCSLVDEVGGGDFVIFLHKLDEVPPPTS